MGKRKVIKSIEISLIVIFSLLAVYLLATGVLSSTGIDHAWPYPAK